ncbi:aldo/keto reductase [Streptomyces sp. CNQ-509]|uniref:aldo/keto reductase n=1 Tax=Streptomyces sp. CNQ-509 TaxID=444103 RepID=UPI00265730E6|nr:aldo/keto reductase [Streptomyces sp. CNQ-509]
MYRVDEAVALGITHIDTAGAYGPRVTNQLIREALHPYPASLHIVTKVGGTRDAQGGWPPARRPGELRAAVRENLDDLGLDALDVVNLRLGDAQGPGPGSLAEARSIAPVVCVQNMYNLAHRQDDDLIDELAAQGIAYVPFFPLGGFTRLQSTALSAVAARLDATPMAVALAWLLRRSPNILLIPGTSSVAHLRENTAGAGLALSGADMAELGVIGR